MKTIYDFAVKDRKGKDVSLKEYANEVLLIVNTATKCGLRAGGTLQKVPCSRLRDP